MSSIDDLLKNNSNDEATSQIKPAQKDLESGFALANEELDIKINEMQDKKHEDELKIKAGQMNLGYVDFKGVPIQADVISQIPFDVCRTNGIVCFYFLLNNKARIAVSEEFIDLLPRLTGLLPEEFLKISIEWFLTSKKSFTLAMRQYEKIPQTREPVRGVEITSEDFEAMSGNVTSLHDIKAKIKDVSVTELVVLIVAAGIKTEASDIHIEAEVDGIKLRYRIDGVLHTAAIIEKEMWHKMISRIKLLAKLKLNIVNKPQDGRFSIFLKNEKVDVRLSSLPTAYGESVVMRLLRSKSIGLKFKDIGLSEKYLTMLSKEMKRPNGMIITTGPTGSGKTTTLYAILNELNTSETKIITVEDPIEYELQGINQSQVDAGRDYTFAKGLRSLVRQDPDIVMVGEMRDLETVDIALNAALTGHLVLSTLHTNDAAGAIPRFLAMGAKPYLLAPALNLIMAQRLVRKLCVKCKQILEIDEATQDKIWAIVADMDLQEIKKKEDLFKVNFFKAVGCDECNQIGYKGRVGIFEMFNITPEIEQIILSAEMSEYKIRDIAKKNGMLTMAQEGLLKAIQGITSIEEVFRVTE
ncbi:MAG: GspE/PulE family protein [Patescibacteria group bacterium]